MKKYKGKTYKEWSMIVKSYNIKNHIEWVKKHKSIGLPGKINRVFPCDWVDWFDFGGFNVMRKNIFGTYEQSKAIALQYVFKDTNDYRDRSYDLKLPGDPKTYYGDQFISWKDFANINAIIKNKRQSYEVCRKIARAQHYTSPTHYRKTAVSLGLPLKPERFFVEVWAKNGEWLDYADFIARKVNKYPSFKDACLMLHKLNFKDRGIYMDNAKALGLPPKPSDTYRKFWDRSDGNNGWLTYANITLKKKIIKKKKVNQESWKLKLSLLTGFKFGEMERIKDGL